MVPFYHNSETHREPSKTVVCCSTVSGGALTSWDCIPTTPSFGC